MRYYKSSYLFPVATFCLIVLFVTSTRLSLWSYSFDGSYYYRSHRNNSLDSRPIASAADSKEYSDHGNASNSTPSVPTRFGSDSVCDNFPDTSSVFLVMKTGASESFSKVPTQLMTNLRCLPDFLIFSDLEQHIAGHKIYDSLAKVLPEAKDGNPDFDIYRQQAGCDVTQNQCHKLGHDAGSKGWDLDKYKNIHMAEDTYKMRPGFKWYLFVDADTYIVWPNLIQWLSMLRSTDKHYIGSIAIREDRPFGHGGAGYLVSQAAMYELLAKHPGVANEYNLRTINECCGDLMFAQAMKEKANIPITQAWPTINGEKPSTLPFGPSTWCHPIVSMHHVDSEEVSDFWAFERRHFSAQDAPKLLLMKDIFYEFYLERLRERRVDWDNWAKGQHYFNKTDTRFDKAERDAIKPEKDMTKEEKVAHLSPDNCAAACRSVPHQQCFRWRYYSGYCVFEDSMTLGTPIKRAEKEEDRMYSGWDVEKILAWVKDNDDCSKPIWPSIK